MGLILSKRIANLLGGDVRLVHSEVSKGSTFEIKIKTGPARMLFSPSAPHVRVLPKEDLRLDGIKILLAENSPDLQFLTRYELELAGASIDLASNGMEALEKVRQEQYDTILMDIQMPVMDGYEAISKLRQMECKSPIIALTAHAMLEEKERCKEAGFTDHLSKPINPDLLIRTIVQATSKVTAR